MKKRIIILAFACFLSKNLPALLEEILLSDLKVKNNKKTHLINLAEKKQPAASSNGNKSARCCAFLDCLRDCLGNSKTQSAFTNKRGMLIAPAE